MAKLTALQPINHDGKQYDEGDVLDLSDQAQIAQLVDAGAAVVKGTRTKAAVVADAAEAAAKAAAEADAAAAAEAAADIAAAALALDAALTPATKQD
jgi:hypothetical protein